MPDGATMASNFRGNLKVTIEEVGTFEVDPSPIDYPLFSYAAQVYCYLTGKNVITSADDWELVSFDSNARTLVARYRPTTG